MGFHPYILTYILLNPNSMYKFETKSVLGEHSIYNILRFKFYEADA